MTQKKTMLLAVPVILVSLCVIISIYSERSPAPGLDRAGEQRETSSGPLTELPAQESKGSSASNGEQIVLPESGSVDGRAERMAWKKRESTTLAPPTKLTAWEKNRIDVTVLDFLGRPIAGTKLESENPELLFGRFTMATAVTGQDGRARLADMPEGPVRVIASMPGFATATSEIVMLTAEDNQHELKITLGAGGTLIGTVLDLNGKPAAGAQVSTWLDRLRGEAGETFDAPRAVQKTRTGPDGSFRLEHLPPGLHDVRIVRLAQSTQGVIESSTSVEVLEGQITEVVFDDHSSTNVSVRGMVRCNGQPRPNTIVTVDPFRRSSSGMEQSTTTDKSGHFEVLLPDSGQLLFKLGLNDGTSVYRDFTIPAVRSHYIEFIFDTGRISGLVLGPDGSPMAGVSLMALGRLPGERWLRGAKHLESGSDGTFNMLNLPGAVYSIEATRRPKLGQMDSSLAPTIRGPVYGRPDLPLVGSARLEGIELGADVVLAMSTAAAIQGSVVGPDGEPVGSGCLRVWPLGGDVFRDTTDWSIESDGTVLAGGLAPADYMVRAETRHDVSPWYAVSAKAGQITVVDFALARGTMIHITATQGGESLSGRFVQAGNPQGMPEPYNLVLAGTALLGPLAPGVYRVEIGGKGRDEPSVHKIIRSAGEETIEVLLELP